MTSLRIANEISNQSFHHNIRRRAQKDRDLYHVNVKNIMMYASVSVDMKYRRSQNLIR